MSLELKKVVIGLTEEAYAALETVAAVHDHNLGEAGRIALTEHLLGKSHSIRIVAARFARATKQGNQGNGG